MNPELITRLVKLIEKTGDRVILPDVESGKAVVVMGLDAYEQLTGAASADPTSVAVSEPSAASSGDPDTTPSSDEPSVVPKAVVAPTVPNPSVAPAESPSEPPRPAAPLYTQGVQQRPTPMPPSSLPVAEETAPDAPVGHRHPPAPEPNSGVSVPEKVEGSDSTENTAENRSLRDLTQEQLLDRINRDIDDWKTAQDARRTDELRSAVHGLDTSESSQDQLEEEERFFLEPIE